jgi:diguanylate cyclase (GGDEF)-like protein/PAS domain S-box-containing protein
MISLSRRILLKIVLSYVILAAAWIALSDRLLLFWFRDPVQLAIASTLKGWVFVAVTATMLTVMLRRALLRFERDRAQLSESHERFSNVFDTVSDAILIQDPLSGAILDVNQRCAELYGYTREDFLQMCIGDISAGFLPYTQAEAQCWMLKATTQGPQCFDWQAKDKQGQVFWVEVALRLVNLSGENLVLVMVHDIRERKRLEYSLRRRQSMFAVLSGANQTIVHSKSRQELFDQVCQVVLKMGMFRLVWIGDATPEHRDDPVVPVALAGEAANFLQQLRTHSWNELIAAETPSGMACKTQQYVVVNDFSISDNPIIERVDQSTSVYQLYSGLAMPIAGGGFSGTLTMYASEKNFFDEEVVALMLEVASDVSFALKNLHEAELQAATMEQLQLLARVFEESRDGIVITDGANNIVMINRALAEMFGYGLEEIQGRNPRLYRSGRHREEFYREMWATLKRDGGWQGEIWNRRKDGELLPCWAKIHQVRDDHDRLINYIGIFSDLAERKAKEELQWLKRFDALTRLPNRLLLEDRTSEAIMHARQAGHEVALLSVNLDRFHYVNETLGHTAADKVLQMIAERFCLAVGESGTVSRVSGGAFVVLLPEIQDSAQAVEVANRLLKTASQVYELDGTKISQTTCIGIALFPVDGDDFETLLKHSDAARIEAVETGGNHYRFYIEDLNNRARQRLNLSAELHQALENQWFVLYYQPQVDAISGKVTGVEALLRLQHPERGLIPPSDFIPVAEETGIIIPLGAWVIREACQQLKRWQRFTGLTMAINLSPVQLQDGLLFDTIHQALLDTGINPRQVEFEFTESALMRNSISTLGVMQRLKSLGVRLSIDDFGTGYSSLSYLKQFPIDRIKIDQSFVYGIPGDPNDVAIVQAIVALSRALGLATIGEGVETANQADFLRVLHCDELQGYHFARPAPAQDMEIWIEGHQNALLPDQ